MIWQNLISHRADVDPLELLPQEHNFRIHALNQRQVTTASLDELGHVGDIIVNVRTGKIVNGHLRVELAIAEAQDRVPVTYIDCDEATEKIILAFFDEVGVKAITDGDRLKATIAKIDIGSSTLQASLDEWVLALKPKKAGKGKSDEDEDDEEPGFLDASAAASAAPVAAVEAPAAAAVEPAAASAAPVAAVEAPAAAAAVEPAAAPAAAVEAAPTAPVAPVAAVAAPAVAPAPLPAVEAVDLPVSPPAILGSQPQGGDDGDGAGEGVAPTLVEPLPPPVPVAPLPPLKVVQDDALAAAIVEDVRAAQAEDAPPSPPAVAAPTEYLIKVGEFDQMVPAAVFAPWFAALCAQHGNGHAALTKEIRRRLKFD